MKAELLVTVQVYQNYADDIQNDNYWKPKGATHFVIPEVDVDLLQFNQKVTVIEAISRMLTERSDRALRYEFVDYEIRWEQPMTLSATDFANNISNINKLRKRK